MDKIFDCGLYVCDNSTAVFNDKMKEQEKFKEAVNNSECNGYHGKMKIICVKNIPVVVANQVNYATEILTGVKIPIIGRGVYVNHGGVNIGKIIKPYYARARLGYIFSAHHVLPYPYGIDSTVTTEMLNKYIEKHIGEDGTFDSYKEELEKLMEDSIKEYEKIQITEYIMEESVNDIYKQLKRTRSK